MKTFLLIALLCLPTLALAGLTNGESTDSQQAVAPLTAAEIQYIKVAVQHKENYRVLGSDDFSNIEKMCGIYLPHMNDQNRRAYRDGLELGLKMSIIHLPLNPKEAHPDRIFMMMQIVQRILNGIDWYVNIPVQRFDLPPLVPVQPEAPKLLDIRQIQVTLVSCPVKPVCQPVTGQPMMYTSHVLAPAPTVIQTTGWFAWWHQGSSLPKPPETCPPLPPGDSPTGLPTSSTF